jgi:hypothetical protein
MCLVFLALQLERNHPVMIGANREEFYRRPTTSPVCCRNKGLRCLIAGADHGPDGTLPELGTWLGVNESGLAVAVTNRVDGELPWEAQTRSRGLLAMTLLGHDDPETAAEIAHQELTAGGFGGTNLLIAAPEGGFLIQAQGARHVTSRQLSAGVHAVSSLDREDYRDPRVDLVYQMLDPARFLDTAQQICRDQRILLRGPDRGTISSSIILVGSPIFLHHRAIPGQAEYQSFEIPSRLSCR